MVGYFAIGPTKTSQDILHFHDRPTRGLSSGVGSNPDARHWYCLAVASGHSPSRSDRRSDSFVCLLLDLRTACLAALGSPRRRRLDGALAIGRAFLSCGSQSPRYLYQMPYQWSETPPDTELKLWPHQSLTPRGFTWFIGITAAMLAMPLLAVLGSPVAWVLMVFFAIALLAVWRAIAANQRHRSMHEALTLSAERVHLAHRPNGGPTLEWEANPYWVSVHIRKDGPVENYLTLKGGGREVEIGRFLTSEERAVLYDELCNAFRPARIPHDPN